MRLERALGVAAEPGGGLGHLHGLGDPQGGAGLGLHQRDELVAVALLEQVGDAVEQLGALLGRGARPGRKASAAARGRGVGVGRDGLGGARPTTSSVAGLTMS